MTKKLFLAAASVAALAIAGGATAGDISGSFGAAPFTAAAPYKVASELVVSGAAKAEGSITANLDLTTDIVIPVSAQRDHLVTFTVVGADISSPELAAFRADGTTDATGATTSLISNTGGVATFLVTIANETVGRLALTAGVSQSAKAEITVASKVEAVIGATNILVDTGAVTKAAEYKPMLAALTVADAYTVTADLNSAYTTVDLGDFEDIVLADDFSAQVTGTTFHGDLDGGVLALIDVLDGGVITVKGPLITDVVTVALAGTPATTTDVNTAVFNLTAAQAATFAGSASEALEISQPTAVEDREAFRAGNYSVTWAPVAKAEFSAPSATTVAAGTVALQGTNFVAPWVSGTGAATSVVRISNSNSAESGAVTVRLVNAVKVVGGVATPYASSAVLEAGTVPAGADLQITSAQLVAAFGEFTRGDIQVTINSDTDGFMAKMRNTRDGATFEQSLNKL